MNANETRAEKLKTVPKRIAVPYAPEAVIGEWGWLWEDDPEGDGGTWMLVATAEANDAGLVTDVWDDGGISTNARGKWDSELLSGQPYISCSAPACEPNAGLLVKIHLPGGGSLSYEHEAGPEAERKMQAVIAALGLAGD